MRDQSLQQEVRIAAINLLSFREHGFDELVGKLSRRFVHDVVEHEIVEMVVQYLADEGLQSDRRFVESCIRQGVSKKHGSARISSDLRRKGVSGSIVSEALNEADVDWFSLAAELYERKYGSERPSDYKERAKRTRFLMYRGFSFKQIDFAMN